MKLPGDLAQNTWPPHRSIMASPSHKEIEYIDGSVPLLNDEYHQEAVEKYQTLPRNSSIPNTVSLAQSKKELRDESKALQALVEYGKQLRKKAEANGFVEKIRQKKRTVTDENRKEIVRFFKELGDKADYRAIARILDKNPSTIRKLLERVKRGESIERSKVKRGRHRIVDGRAAALLDDYFTHNYNTSDAKAAKFLNEKGYTISKPSVQRAVTDGTMENYGYKSLTMQRVYFRGKNAESEENKEARENAIAQLFCYMNDNYHPVFVDETHWEVGWRWRNARYRRGEKNVQERGPQRYSLTAISAISDIGPIYTLLVQNSSINAQKFNDYMVNLLDREKDRRIVIFLDNAPVHKHEELEEMVNGIDKKHIVFNAPYSPECNPIEKFFSEWKRRVDAQIEQPPDPATMIQIIEKQFMSFTADYCLDLINDLRKNIVPKVLNHEIL